MTTAALSTLADLAFSDSIDNRVSETHALVVAREGQVIFERYADGFDDQSTFLSWSMGKSMVSALCGVLASQGLVQLDRPAPVSAWHERADDPRGEITLRHLLQMRSGLEWNEDYVDEGVSDVIEMLFGGGQDDTAGYAVSKPLVHAPGDQWLYSSGTTNVVSRILGDVVGGGVPGIEKALVDDLLRPAGLTKPTIKCDSAGTFVGSSFVYATARDYLAFGELFRNDGCVEGRRLLPEGWVAESTVDHATCPDTGQGYGLHWWITRDGHGSFSANGYEGQRCQVVPDLGLTIVRLGKTSADFSDDLASFYADVVGCFG